ncbi:hypothetical protein [Pseudonocardia sp. T1-2H]|uniref:hypothetical protein n=1 Tax=Pseudonocardia sp. T1-2H TaxID=3128899 RepID=UPI003100CBC9
MIDGTGIGGQAATVTSSPEGSSASTVTYGVDGSAGGVAQESEASLPWPEDVRFTAGTLQGATVSARYAGNGGDITCKTAIDGKWSDSDRYLPGRIRCENGCDPNRPARA